MDSHPHAALGKTCRHLHGTVPRDLRACEVWLWREFGVSLMVRRDLVREGFGVALGRIRCILLRAGLPHWRFVVAHELGHIETNQMHELAVALDNVHDWEVNPAERAATYFAATLLMDADDVSSLLYAGVTVQEIADRFAVPVEIVALRDQLRGVLQEYNPGLASDALNRLTFVDQAAG